MSWSTRPEKTAAPQVTGGIPAHAPDDNVPPRRPVLERILIRSWEYRHLRAWAGMRIAGGVVLTGLGLVTLIFGGNDGKTDGWSAAFLVPAAVNFAFGYWQITIADAALPRRVRELEQSRARVVDDSAASHRRWLGRGTHRGPGRAGRAR